MNRRIPAICRQLKIAAALTAAVAAAGCAERREGGGAAANPSRPPAASGGTGATFVDGVTGRSAVRAQKRAQDQIRKISAEHSKDLESALE